MKKLSKIFLPVATVATLATCAVPLTSCGDETYEVKVTSHPGVAINDYESKATKNKDYSFKYQFLTGYELDTESSQITVDGNPLALSDLKIDGDKCTIPAAKVVGKIVISVNAKQSTTQYGVSLKEGDEHVLLAGPGYAKVGETYNFTAMITQGYQLDLTNSYIKVNGEALKRGEDFTYTESNNLLSITVKAEKITGPMEVLFSTTTYVESYAVTVIQHNHVVVNAPAKAIPNEDFQFEWEFASGYTYDLENCFITIGGETIEEIEYTSEITAKIKAELITGDIVINVVAKAIPSAEFKVTYNSGDHFAISAYPRCFREEDYKFTVTLDKYYTIDKDNSEITIAGEKVAAESISYTEQDWSAVVTIAGAAIVGDIDIKLATKDYKDERKVNIETTGETTVELVTETKPQVGKAWTGTLKVKNETAGTTYVLSNLQYSIGSGSSIEAVYTKLQTGLYQFTIPAYEDEGDLNLKATVTSIQNEYDVSVLQGAHVVVSCKDKAYFGEQLTGSITLDDNYLIDEATYSIGGGAEQSLPLEMDNTFVINGSKITGDIVIRVTAKTPYIFDLNPGAHVKKINVGKIDPNSPLIVSCELDSGYYFDQSNCEVRINGNLPTQSVIYHNKLSRFIIAASDVKKLVDEETSSGEHKLSITIEVQQSVGIKLINGTSNTTFIADDKLIPTISLGETMIFDLNQQEGERAGEWIGVKKGYKLAELNSDPTNPEASKTVIKYTYLDSSLEEQTKYLTDEDGVVIVDPASNQIIISGLIIEAGSSFEITVRTEEIAPVVKDITYNNKTLIDEEEEGTLVRWSQPVEQTNKDFKFEVDAKFYGLSLTNWKVVDKFNEKECEINKDFTVTKKVDQYGYAYWEVLLLRSQPGSTEWGAAQPGAQLYISFDVEGVESTANDATITGDATSKITITTPSKVTYGQDLVYTYTLDETILTEEDKKLGLTADDKLMITVDVATSTVKDDTTVINDILDHVTLDRTNKTITIDSEVVEYGCIYNITVNCDWAAHLDPEEGPGDYKFAVQTGSGITSIDLKTWKSPNYFDHTKSSDFIITDTNVIGTTGYTPKVDDLQFRWDYESETSYKYFQLTSDEYEYNHSANTITIKRSAFERFYKETKAAGNRQISLYIWCSFKGY